MKVTLGRFFSRRGSLCQERFNVLIGLNCVFAEERDDVSKFVKGFFLTILLKYREYLYKKKR